MEISPSMDDFDIDILYVKLSNHLVRRGIGQFSQRTRENYGLIFIADGCMTHILNNKRTIANRGDIVLLKKGETYSLLYNDNAPEASCEFFVLSFDVAEGGLSFLKRLNKVKRYEKYAELFKEADNCIGCQSIPKNGRKIKAKALTYEILYNLFIDHCSTRELTPAQRNIEQARSFIDLNYKNKITADEMAAASGYSMSYFKKLFKEFYGVSPGEYLTMLRINKAKALLESRLFSLSEIADECGFSSESYFSHAFKRVVGCSPKKY